MRFAGRVALAAATLSLMMLAVAVGVGQGQSAGTGDTATVPSQLTDEYPLGERKLCCAEDGATAGAAPAGGSSQRAPEPTNGPDDGDSMLWVVLLAPVAVLVFLVWFVAYARSGPPTAYGYALGNEPRRRRRVPSSVITLLTPLFAYNHHRDAYVLRGIGNRRGPVLKVKHEGAETWAARPATALPAAAPLGVRGEVGPARVVRQPAPAAKPAPAAARPVVKPPAAPAARSAPAPRRRSTPARATPNGGAPANGTASERATRPAAAPTAAPTQPPAAAEREEPRDTDAVADPKAKPKSAKGKAGKKGKAAKASKNGKAKKAPAAPKANKPKANKPKANKPKANKPKAKDKVKPAETERTPSLTDALTAEGKTQSARAKRRAAYRARHGGGAGSPEREVRSEDQRPSPTGRFNRDEPPAARENRPATWTRE